MPTRTAFLSSTGKDLAEYRQAVFEAINGLDGWKCVRMEDFGARTRPINAFDAEAVKGCDLFIGILGHCYGTVPKIGRKSYTEQEYDIAVALHLPRLMFLAPDHFPIPAHLRESEDFWERQKAFRARVQANQLPGRFSTPASLANQVLQAIRNWEATAQQHGETTRHAQSLNTAISDIILPRVWPNLLRALFSYPRYIIRDFFALLTKPKRFIDERSADGRLTLGRAFGFLLTIYFIRIIAIGTPAQLYDDVQWTVVCVATLCFFLLFSWWSVGKGRAAPHLYIPIYLYYFSIYVFLTSIIYIVGNFIISYRTEQYAYGTIDELLKGNLDIIPKNVNQSIQTLVFWYVFYQILSLTAMLTWFLAGWGAYRKLDNTSKLRSGMAALVFVILIVLGNWLLIKTFGRSLVI